MSLKDQWKNTGKSIGSGFKNFGKAMATTAKVTFGNEEKVDENGNSKLKQSWSNVGHGFGDAGKSIGKSAEATAKHATGKDKKEPKKKTKKSLMLNQ